MLVQSQVAHYLVEKKLVSPACIVGSDLAIAEVSCRNRNFRSLSTTGPSYFLKHGVGADASATVAHEARVYRLLQKLPGAKSFLHRIPKLVEYDSQRRVLILESLNNAHDLREYFHRTGRFPISAATELGRALSSLHRIPAAGHPISRKFGMEGRIPWILSICRPGLHIFHESSVASLEMIQILQNTRTLPRLFDDIKSDWKSNALIHNDIKWDNCLVIARSNGSIGRRLKIIDWELANLGDSGWDVGSVLGSFLSAWVFSIPVSGQDPPDHYRHLARYPLVRAQKAISAFWRAYVAGMHLSQHDSAAHLLRATRYAAMRLFQTAFEQAQHSATLCSSVVCLLQLGQNILERPEEAAGQLLGLSDVMNGDQ